MENLRSLSIIFGALLILLSCGDDTVTQVIKVRTDTYISSIDQSNHSNLNFLNLSKTSAKEERIILKIPTTSSDDELDDCFDITKPCGIFLMPVSILVRILTSCQEAVMVPANLTSAILVLNTNDGSSISAGTLDLNLLTKPWWQSANWFMAHPFSIEGKWLSPGGDKDTSAVFDTNCSSLSSGSCAAGEVKFELTNFFRSLISNANSKHYGILISPNTNISESSLYSVQANSAFSPRIVATYTGSCSSSKKSEERTFYLGSEGLY